MSPLERKFTAYLWLLRWTPVLLGIYGLDEHLLIRLPDQFLMNIDLALGLLVGHGQPLLIQKHTLLVLDSKAGLRT